METTTSIEQQAKELADRFRDKALFEIEIVTRGRDCDYEVLNWDEVAKQCVLICVDREKERLNNFSADTDTVNLQMTEVYFKELEQLRSAIEKL